MMKKIVSNMPKGIIALYFVQALTTFSYATLYSSLALFLTKQLQVEQRLSSSIVGLFLALNYVLQLIGGLLGGRFLSNRVLFVLASLIEILGLFTLTTRSTSLLFVSLSMFLVGCGISFTCYNNMLTQRFSSEDERRETAFILSYAMMSIGFFAGYTLSGVFDYTNEYQGLFYTAILMDALTILFILRNWSVLADTNTPLAQVNSLQGLRNNLVGTLLTLGCIPLLVLSFKATELSNNLVITISVLMFLAILYLGLRQKSKIDKDRIMAYLLLAIISVLFWMIYFTGPMGVILFIKNNTDRHLFGYEIATQWLLNINPLVIIVCAPLLSLLINSLQNKFNFSISVQFACGFILLGLSFFALACGISFSGPDGLVSLSWVIFYFIFQGISELLIAPVGYAMIGRIAPLHLQGLMMGSWMLVAGAAASLSHYFANEMVTNQTHAPELTNENYLSIFEQLGIWALAGAVFLFLVTRKVKAFINQTVIEG
ncbi:peptide MFS transporter [Legionella rowbothamii]|uniref:peptide MFS transporter n=1 Tax=Legionella rowbothamii TaxID=96229 RepID=UPI001F5F2D2F|nr:oligopeptide:H+ symporter [Legionella rowbothamii]